MTSTKSRSRAFLVAVPLTMTALCAAAAPASAAPAVCDSGAAGSPSAVSIESCGTATGTRQLSVEATVSFAGTDPATWQGGCKLFFDVSRAYDPGYPDGRIYFDSRAAERTDCTASMQNKETITLSRTFSVDETWQCFPGEDEWKIGVQVSTVEDGSGREVRQARALVSVNDDC